MLFLRILDEIEEKEKEETEALGHIYHPSLDCWSHL